MSEPKKKSPRQRNIDKLAVTRAESKLANVAEDYVETLLAHEMDPAYIPIKFYLDLIEAHTVLATRRKRQQCSMVVDGWPRTDDGDYVCDDMTLESCYQEKN